MANLFDKRFIINTGKGGVGKTTISAAMAIAFAQKGKRVLLMALNAHDKFGAWFGQPSVGPEIRQLAPHISAVNTNPDAALREYALLILKSKTLYKVVFENKVVRRFLRAVPGLPELTMLGKAYYHEQETDDHGRKKWDVVIVDAPATGHGMFLLQIPQVISGAVAKGLMTKEANRMVELLQDQRRTLINLVTLTEEMPVNETLEYQRRLKSDLEVSAGHVVANGVFPRTFAPEDVDRVTQLLDTHASTQDDLGAILSAAVFRAERCDMQAGYLERINRESGLPSIEVPFYFDAQFDKTVLERIAVHITESVERDA